MRVAARHMLRAHRGIAPTGIAVQWGNYEEVDPRTGARITVPKQVEYASDTLAVRYIVWEPQEPFFRSGVLPFLAPR